MSHKKIQISIPKPCSEEWSNMTPTERGRFCASCTKEVVDFRHKNEEEIQGYFKGAEGKVCGRFTQSQLNRNINSTPCFKLHPALSVQNWLAASVVFGTFEWSRAQHENSSVQQTPIEVYLTSSKHQDSSATSTAEKRKLILSGKVLDATTREPMSFVSVFVSSASAGSRTDFEGRFVFLVNVDTDQKTVDLELRYVGYHDKLVTLNLPHPNDSDTLELSNLAFVLSENEDIALQGEVVIDYASNKPLKRLFRKLKFWNRLR